MSFHWICFSTWCLFVSKYFQVNDSLVSHLLGHQVRSFALLLSKEVTPKGLLSQNDPALLVLVVHADILQIPHSDPPSLNGKLKFFNDAQWYIFLLVLHPEEKTTMKIWICLSIEDVGVIADNKGIGKDWITYFVRTALQT